MKSEKLTVRIADGFWKQKTELVRTKVIPYQWKALNDEVEGAQPSYCMRNYEMAGRLLRGELEQRISDVTTFQVLPDPAKGMEETFYGFAFQDSDFSKWLEAAAYSLEQHPDDELEAVADRAIDIVCAAQREDGYLNTYFLLRNPDAAFTNLRDYHELYCFGHLAEAAVAYSRATGKNKLLSAVERFADCIDRHIGSQEGKLHGYPGHEEAELALIKLYELTGSEKYLRMASYFIDERGKQPYFFDKELQERQRSENGELAAIAFAGANAQQERYCYHQAHRPVREQGEAVGHAVRAVYLYSAMADAARLTGDEELKLACERLWNSITKRKLYITGGIGGTHMGEAFSHDYDLPADTAYSETCAAIGLVFFASRMLAADPDSRYANVMERALYNGVISGMALDGQSFFYVNPLECRPDDCRKDERKQHVKPVRQQWFGCACCPPNLARLISSISHYAFAVKDSTVFIHLLMNAGLTVNLPDCDEPVNLTVTADMPWSGKGSVCVSGIRAGEKLTIALRIPDWTDDFSVGGKLYDRSQPVGEKGYLYIDITEDGEIPFDFSMPVRFVNARPEVREAAGQTALMRGPIVYCLEQTDNGADLHLLSADTHSHTVCRTDGICGERIVSVTSGGTREVWPDTDMLYHSGIRPRREQVTLKWVPYYTWANRGENEMRVWVREQQ